MKSQKNVYSVKQINSYIKNLLKDDFILNNICVKGEVSNCKYHHSGHIYFSLKDDSAALKVVMFSSDAMRLRFRLEDGMQVIVTGSISVYEKSGEYQLYAKEAEEAGKGELNMQYEELRARLEEMGMFSAEYKKPVPEYAVNIGVVTAETGAVIHDIENIAKRRNPYCRITLYPAQVQGEGAAESICKGIKVLDSMGLDVIIVGRGGGSAEDLWCFNDESVAHAIFDCSTPVISAVGHETDVTIADFVADRRAATPSEAAELAVFDYAQFEASLEAYRKMLGKVMMDKCGVYSEKLLNYGKHIEALSPASKLRESKQELAGRVKMLDQVLYSKIKESKAELEQAKTDLAGAVLVSADKSRDKTERKAADLENAMDRRLERARNQLSLYSERLEGLSPLRRISSGYAFVTDSKGHAVRSTSDVEVGDKIDIRVSDGKLTAKVEKKVKRSKIK